MSEVVQFIRKRDIERACLIQEARANLLHSIFRRWEIIWGMY